MNNVDGLSYRRETYDVSRPLVSTFPTLSQVVDLLSPEIPVDGHLNSHSSIVWLSHETFLLLVNNKLAMTAPGFKTDIL